jgi:hypothetical protein
MESSNHTKNTVGVMEQPRDAPSMNTLPSEILDGIAAHLPGAVDIGNFRLIEKRCASAAFHILFRRIQLLNTVNCLINIEEFFASPYGSSRITRHLTLHHATWPLLWTPSTWRDHPLRVQPSPDDAQALESYLRFIQTEATDKSHRGCDSRIQEVLRQFVQLQSLSITDVQSHRYRPARNHHLDHLKSRIRMVPSFQGRLNEILEEVSPVFNSMPSLNALSIEGSLDISTTTISESFPGITDLRVTGLLMNTATSEDFQRFLLAFPNLTHILLRPASLGRPSERSVPLAVVQLAKLRHAELYDIWTSESALLNFAVQNRLHSLSLIGINLIQGSWKSFFTQLRLNLPQIHFDGSGMLWATESQGYWLDIFSLRLLRMYLTAQDFPWPFGV